MVGNEMNAQKLSPSVLYRIKITVQWTSAAAAAGAPTLCGCGYLMKDFRYPNYD